ncbi:TonB-dependent receptor [Sphingosinicella soli]|uniref:Iron complex outermembrane receptor protein n=1 Tax=Sphingosinicella soli TaxID=333708 RepID=A0A7W7B4H6_9SPHN|nr:TonB-dependent receptor [Sphingosinicella soli]MBB4633837.1 iron complex outermembrane receptor protein [Sphingosinicella soli]
MIRNAFLAGASLFVLSVAAEAQAQVPATEPEQPSTSTGEEPNEEAVSQDLGEIVVTAQRRSERLQDVPITVTTISTVELRNAGVTAARNLQNVVSGFNFSAFGTSPQPSIRGVSTTNSRPGAENPNALYIDGIYFGAQPVLANDFGDIERIEVLKGPQGTLFGRNATGGAIQIFTRQPSFTPQMDFTLEGGFYTGSGESHTAEHLNMRAFVTTPLVDDLLAVSFSGGYNYTPGYYTNVLSGEGDGGVSQLSARGKVLFTPTSSLKMTLSGYFINNRSHEMFTEFAVNGLSVGLLFPGSAIASKPWQTAPGDAFTKGDTEIYGGSAKIELDVGAGTLSSLTGYNNLEISSLGPFYAAAVPDLCRLQFICIDYGLLFSTEEFSQEVNFASRDLGIFRFVTGLFYYKANGGAIGSILEQFIPGGFRVQDDTFRTSSYAAYGEGTIEASDALSLTAGVRCSRDIIENGNRLIAIEGKNTFNSFIPRLSVLYKLTPDVNIYATYSQGFKSGISGAVNFAAPVQFEPVRPEKITAYEAGIKYATRNFVFNLSAFYYDYKNKQEQSFFGTTNFTTNTGPVKIYGIDLDANIRLTPELTLTGTFSWLPKAEYQNFPNASGTSTILVPGVGYIPGIGNIPGATFDATGTRLIRSPEITTAATMSYRKATNSGEFDASATVTYTSRTAIEITRAIVQDPYATLAAQAGFRFDSGLRIGIYGRNLTNKDYLVGGFSTSGGFFGTPTPPREVGISLGYKY